MYTVDVCMSTCVHVRTYTVGVCTYVYVCLCLHVCTYVYMCTHIHVLLFMYAHNYVCMLIVLVTYSLYFKDTCTYSNMSSSAFRLLLLD